MLENNFESQSLWPNVLKFLKNPTNYELQLLFESSISLSNTYHFVIKIFEKYYRFWQITLDLEKKSILELSLKELFKNSKLKLDIFKDNSQLKNIKEVEDKIYYYLFYPLLKNLIVSIKANLKSKPFAPKNFKDIFMPSISISWNEYNANKAFWLYYLNKLKKDGVIKDFSEKNWEMIIKL